MRKKSSLRKWLRLLLWGSAVVFLGVSWWQLFRGETDWASILDAMDGTLFIAALVIQIVAHSFLPLLGYLNHTELGYDIDRSRAYRYWFLSQLAKYIPGGIWQMTAKAVLYHENGMPRAVATASSIWELIVILTGALTVGLLGIGILPANLRVIVAAAILTAVSAGFFSMWPAAWLVLKRIGIKLAVIDVMLDLYQTVGRARWTMFVKQYVVIIAIWTLMGTSFFVLLASLQRDVPISWAEAVGTFAFGWSIGFVVLVSPGGVGPREAAVTAMLAPSIGLPTAFAVALMSRFQWTVAEGIHIMITGILHIGAKRRVQPNE